MCLSEESRVLPSSVDHTKVGRGAALAKQVSRPTPPTGAHPPRSPRRASAPTTISTASVLPIHAIG